jgi:hypothetical protein
MRESVKGSGVWDPGSGKPLDLQGGASPALRDAIARDLRPVRPLARPAIRVLWLAPLALLLLVASVAAFGLRRDSPALGVTLTWGASGLEMVLGLGLIAAALREAVTGTSLTRRALGTAFVTTVIAIGTVTWLTWIVSPTRIAPWAVLYVWRVCFGATILTALPALAVSGWLTARAFPLRPRYAGALYGLGSGLLADAGWRLFCHYSEPAHVFGAHTGAVAVVCALGILLATILARAPRSEQ